MSRRRSTSAMGPPPDRDAVMGPPTSTPSSTPMQKGKDGQEITEKYRKLKRRFFELEEKHKETSTELQRSGERNVKMREERNILLDRIIELESETQTLNNNGRSSASPPSLPLAQPSSSAFPRTLLSARARTSFIANLRQANAEDDADDEADPILTSRHIGPQARRRSEDERKERQEEHTPELRRSSRKTRASYPQGPTMQTDLPNSAMSSVSTGGKMRAGRASPDCTSPPSGNNAMASSSSSSRAHSGHSPPSSTQPHPHVYTHPPPPPPHHFHEQHHYSNHQQHPLTPEQDSYHQAPPSPHDIDVEMGDDRSTSGYRYSPPPNSSYAPLAGDSPKKDELDSDHRLHGNPEKNGYQDGPSGLTSEIGLPVSSSRDPKTTVSTPANKESSRPRRSSRVAAADNQDRDNREPEQHQEHGPRTRGATAKRAAQTSASNIRVTRSESAALAAAAAEAEAQVQLRSAPCGPTPSPNNPTSASPIAAPASTSEDVPVKDTSVSMQDKKQVSPSLNVKQDPSPPPAPSPTAAHVPFPTPPATAEPSEHPSTPSPAQDPNIDPALSNGTSTLKNAPAKEPSPMDSIVKVAEAAVAAQNAANASQDRVNKHTPSSSVSPTPGSSHTAGSPTSSSAPPSASPSSTTFTNPYMITTQMPIPKPTLNTMGVMAPGTPGMPMTHPLALSMNPYTMYYPPGTPVTPNTPTYAHPYGNPYYYLAAPMAGPSGMYPTSPNFVPPSAQRPPSEVQRHAKPKRLKAHTVTSKNFSIPMVPRDKRGKPMLPLNVGIMTVINLGTVCMREHFHTERYIFPVGYEVTRRYLSTVDASVEVVYHCTILDGGDGPKFQIVPSDVPDRPVIAGTATGAWSSIVKQANAIRNRQHSNSVSGPDFFGLGQNTIKHLIQELPNADRLRDYVWQTFVEGGPLGGRHAAVIPALPEEYDTSLPIGAYYPADRDKTKRDATTTPESPRGLSHYPQHIVAQAEAQRAQQQATQSKQHQGEQSAPKGQRNDSSQSPVHQGVTQIVLPPPSSESLNFQEYHPPPVGADKRMTRQASVSTSTGTASPGPLRAKRRTSRSPSAHYPSTRSQPSQSPYSPDAGTSSVTATSPAVPATFASIMNAYPSSGPGSKE